MRHFRASPNNWGIALWLAAAGFWLGGVAPAAHAAALIQPGNPQLRSDVELLADAGYLGAPVTSWPLPWAAISADLQHADTATMSAAQRAAWGRLTSLLGTDRSTHAAVGVSARAGEAPALRWYRSEPRAGQAVDVAVTGGDAGAFSYAVDLGVVHQPDDHREAIRPDGSYASYRAGNWLLDAGWIERWWGPGWGGSVILGTNARPVPGLALARASATPFDLPVLKWLGPWRLTLFVDRMEEDRAIPHLWLLGARVAFRPVSSLTIALSRTTQWGGAGTATDWVHFRDMITGTSYRNTGVPGSSLGAFDLRWHFDLGAQPFALYLQEAGEDTSKMRHLPKRFTGLIGFDTNGGLGEFGSYRLFAEYADTSVGFLGLNGNVGIFNYAYENHQYRSGYRYLGKPLGYPTDNDSRLVTLGAIVTDAQAHRWTVLLRGGVINRDDANVRLPGGNTIARRRADIADAELAWSAPLPRDLGELTVAVGATRLAPAGAEAYHDQRLSVNWSYGL